MLALATLALPASADTSANLAHALEVWQRYKSVDAVAVNRLDRRRRTEFWSHYYQALEQLGRMQVHQRMMTRHGAERGTEFERARREFFEAVEILTPILAEVEP